MKIYSINKNIVKLSWLFLVLWFIFAAGFIILLATRNEYWFVAIPGFVFLFLWTMNVSTYPKSAIVSEDNIALVMSSGKIYDLEINQVEIKRLNSAIAIDFNDDGVDRKLRISQKHLPSEILERIQ